jgi:hypothetical protein
VRHGCSTVEETTKRRSRVPQHFGGPCCSFLFRTHLAPVVSSRRWGSHFVAKWMGQVYQETNWWQWKNNCSWNTNQINIIQNWLLYIPVNRTVFVLLWLSSSFAVVVIHIFCVCNILSLLMFIYVPEKTSQVYNLCLIHLSCFVWK